MTFGKPGRPPEDRLARQREIYQAVAPLILSEGARKLTMRNAAHAAFLSVGGLYHYFSTKRDLVLHGLSVEARRRLHNDGRSALLRRSPRDRAAYLDAYVEHTLTMWEFVHPSVQAALELGHDEFQRRLDAGFAASTAEFAEMLRPVVADLDDERMVELVLAIQRLALGTVIDRRFDRDAARAALLVTLERYLPASVSDAPVASPNTCR